ELLDGDFAEEEPVVVAAGAPGDAGASVVPRVPRHGEPRGDVRVRDRVVAGDAGVGIGEEPEDGAPLVVGRRLEEPVALRVPRRERAAVGRGDLRRKGAVYLPRVSAPRAQDAGGLARDRVASQLLPRLGAHGNRLAAEGVDDLLIDAEPEPEREVGPRL